jgi:hypothetical protein
MFELEKLKPRAIAQTNPNLLLVDSLIKQRGTKFRTDSWSRLILSFSAVVCFCVVSVGGFCIQIRSFGALTLDHLAHNSVVPYLVSEELDAVRLPHNQSSVFIVVVIGVAFCVVCGVTTRYCASGCGRRILRQVYQSHFVRKIEDTA